MFVERHDIHSHWHSACRLFAEKHNKKVANLGRTIGMKHPQTLSNKLNPEQEHEMTVAELISLYHATQDETLFDGALLCCGLTAIAIPKGDRAPSLTHQVINLNSQIASIGQRTLELTESGRITSKEHRTFMSIATAAMGSVALLINDVEQRFQVVSPLAALAM
ncbi:phage regulatory CII family protein [Aeromonas hydrophila]|uniref:phage regulatory CII family protein n=1 Tax=Aeromonas hydrophila TaxID=644 RepID=UPI00191F1CD1|nr:phage regulatory CII family protein [Aeromonas hydrophila]MBL0563141.1 phage regulatory CII family protein [Aeromonas hydrophila]